MTDECQDMFLRPELNEDGAPVVSFCIFEPGHYSPHHDGKEYWTTKLVWKREYNDNE